MSMEEAVRRKHAIERALDKYLKIVATMTREEIEVALGRLEDLFSSSAIPDEKAEYAFKGHVLRSYLELRNSGIKKQQQFKRRFSSQTLTAFKAQIGRERFEGKKNEFEKRLSAWKKNHQEWLIKQRATPFFKRLLHGQDKPLKPSPPSVPVSWGDLAAYNTREDLLIDFAARFSLAPLSPREEDVSIEDVKLLSP